MKFGYTIVYVPDVAASLAFFEKAFGLERRFLHESGTYGELATGETALAFAAHELGDMNFPVATSPLIPRSSLWASRSPSSPPTLDPPTQMQ